MTQCTGRARGVPDHEARHVEARLVVPWNDAVPVRVEVLHRCDRYGCPMYQVDHLEPARDPEAVLRKVLAPRGMLGCSHTLGEPSGFKGCTTACRVYPAPPGNGAAGATCVHAPGCLHGRPAANGHAVPYGIHMDAVRDAPRPAPGTITSDPDDFLRRATSRRPAEDGRPYSG